MLVRDRLQARLRDVGPDADYVQLAADVLGIRGAPPALARRLVEQALVVEDRESAWRAAGARITAAAPAAPGVYVFRDRAGEVLYVGKAVDLRRRLRAHFAPSRWKRLPADMARITDAEWTLVGNELVALLREAEAIATLSPRVNTQVGPPRQRERTVPPALLRDVIVVVPAADADSADLVCARPDGSWLVQASRRDGSDLAVHARRISAFFRGGATNRRPAADDPRLAPLVYSWLAARGRSATRLDPHGAPVSALRERLASLLRDERLFLDRIEQR